MTRKLYGLVLVLGVTACAHLPPPRTLHEAAKIACELFFAKQVGLSAEEAAQKFCETEEQLRPFIEQITTAQQAAGAARLEADGAESEEQ